MLVKKIKVKKMITLLSEKVKMLELKNNFDYMIFYLVSKIIMIDIISIIIIQNK